MLTVAYFTSRKEPCLSWFFDALHRELCGNYDGVRIVIVDFWSQAMDGWTEDDVAARDIEIIKMCRAPLGALIITPPKPTPWQGRHKITEVHWWAACNARNTAICHAPDGWILFMDDISVMLPGYWTELRLAMGREKTISLGAYRKVNNLVVENGAVVSFDDHPAGLDNRFGHGKDGEGVVCGGNWLYGCSLVAPVEAFLEINGFPEAWCDGLSFEDCIAGIMLTKKGYSIEYRRSMMTWESEERHHGGPVMKRSDYGVSPDDKSHAVLRMANAGTGWHPNYFGEEGIRGLRQRILAGEPFPICQIPEHEFYTGKPLKDL